MTGWIENNILLFSVIIKLRIYIIIKLLMLQSVLAILNSICIKRFFIFLRETMSLDSNKQSINISEEYHVMKLICWRHFWCWGNSPINIYVFSICCCRTTRPFSNSINKLQNGRTALTLWQIIITVVCSDSVSTNASSNLTSADGSSEEVASSAGVPMELQLWGYN